MCHGIARLGGSDGRGGWVSGCAVVIADVLPSFTDCMESGLGRQQSAPGAFCCTCTVARTCQVLSRRTGLWRRIWQSLPGQLRSLSTIGWRPNTRILPRLMTH